MNARPPTLIYTIKCTPLPGTTKLMYTFAYTQLVTYINFKIRVLQPSTVTQRHSMLM